MKEPMTWETCCADHIKKVSPDKGKITSMIRLSDTRLKITNNLTVDDETAPVIATEYYEVIKELLTALLLKHGLKSDNHECLVAFMRKNFSKYDYEIGIIYQLKEVRNRVSYDAATVKKSYIDQNKLEFNHIVGLLKELILC